MLRVFKELLARLRGWRPPSPDASSDPYTGASPSAHARARGRNAAVAVMEPEPDQSVDAVGD